MAWAYTFSAKHKNTKKQDYASNAGYLVRMALLKEGAKLSSKDSGPKPDFYELGKKEHINLMLFMQ